MTTESTSLTVPSEKNALVREQFAKGCTDNEFQVFLELANRYGLDPFARQIWAVKGYGSSPAQIMVARDGYLAIAHRSGQFDGMSDPEYDTDDKGKVTHVRIHVYRKDMSHPFTGDAWDDEDNLKQSVWNKRPRTMLLKVAESRALRKAFSVSGTYCPEELGYEEQPVKITPRESDIKVQPEPATPKATQRKVENTYTADMVRDSIIPNYQSHKLNTDVIKRALLDNGLYDKDMIDADYRQQMGLIPAPAPASEPEPEVHDEQGLEKFKEEIKRTIDQPFCVDCGNTRVLPHEEKDSRAKYGVALCPKCMSKRLSEDIKRKEEQKKALDNLVADVNKAEESKQTKPTDTTKSDVCSICGKKLTKGELSKHNMFTPNDPLVCSKCSSKTEN